MILCVLSYTAMNFICKFFSDELSAYQLLFSDLFLRFNLSFFDEKEKGFRLWETKKVYWPHEL